MVVRLSLVAVLLLFSAAVTTTTSAAAAQAKSGCTDKCGNLTIPYPFGMKEGCYLREEFFINCSHTTRSPKAYLTNLIVTNISLEDGELQILGYGAEYCNDAQGNVTSELYSVLTLSLPYTISHSKNKFYAVGCDNSFAQGFRGEDEFNFVCRSVCNRPRIGDQNSCSSGGCCQTSIPGGLKNWTLDLTPLDSHSDIWKFNHCRYSFIAKQGELNFSAAILKIPDYNLLPVVLNFAIGNDTDSCDEAQKRKDFACKANSMCFNRRIVGSGGYLCRCLPGYEGNPYHPGGCQGDL